MASVLQRADPAHHRSWISSMPALVRGSQLWGHLSPVALFRRCREIVQVALCGSGAGEPWAGHWADLLQVSWVLVGGGAGGAARVVGLCHPEHRRGFPELPGCRPRGRGQTLIRTTCLVSHPIHYLPLPRFVHSFIHSFIQAPASAGVGHRPCLVTTGLP